MKIIILCIILFLFVILWLLKSSITEAFQVQDFSSNYTAWTGWIGQFVLVWQNVIQQGLQTEQGTISEDEYILQIQQQYYQDSQGNIQKIPEGVIKTPLVLYRYSTIQYSPTIPISYSDLTHLQNILPQDTSILNTTLDFMIFQINSIKHQTQSALNGKMTVTEGFYFDNIVGTCQTVDPSGDIICNITPGSQGGSQDTTSITNSLNLQLQTLNSNIPSMTTKLQQIQAGLQDLNNIKQSAQDGSLANQVNLPSS